MASKVGKQAPYLDGVPVVASTAQRDALFPSAIDTHQRVENLETGYIERYDGTAWRSMQRLLKGGSRVNASAFDSSGITDKAVVIQAAIDSGASVVDVPENWSVKTPITVPNGCMLWGEGQINSTNLIVAADFAGDAVIKPAAVDSTQEGFVLANLAIDCVTNSPTGITRAVILVAAVSIVTRLSNILVFGVPGVGVAGILCTDNAAETTGQYLMDNIWVNIAGQTGDGLVFEHQGAGGGVGDVLVQNVATENMTGTAKGIWIHGAANADTPGINNITLQNVHIESATNSAWSGVYIDGVRGLVIDGFGIGTERALATGIVITNNVGNNGITLRNVTNGNFFTHLLNDQQNSVTTGTDFLPLYRTPQEGAFGPTRTVAAGAFGGGGTTYGHDMVNGDIATVTKADSTAFTINNPSNPLPGHVLTYEIYNNSGGAMGDISWGNQFVLLRPFAKPPNGQRHTITFHRNASSQWTEVTRNPQTYGVSSDRGDTSPTLTVAGDAEVQRFATNLTANRTVTLSTTGAFTGARFRVVRTGLGAFTLDVGGLKTIASATAAFVDVVYSGSAWVLAGYGAL